MTQSHTVHLPPDGAPRTIEGADGLVLVKDGVSWLALFMPWLWMMIHRMWVPFLGYLAALLVFELMLTQTGAPGGVTALCGGLFTILVALESGALRRWSLKRRGYRMVGVVTGPDLEACEAKAIDGWLTGDFPDADMVDIAGGPADDDDGGVIGLFPEPERGR